MTKGSKRAKSAKGRSLFRELMAGVQAMRDHREGRLTLRTHEVEPITVPPVNPKVVRETREALNIFVRAFVRTSLSVPQRHFRDQYGPQVTVSRVHRREYALPRRLHGDRSAEAALLNLQLEGIPCDDEAVQTVTFEDIGGRTKVTRIATYKTVDDAEGMVASGMESGVIKKLDRVGEPGIDRRLGSAL
jgi:hypothetical protein